MSDDLIYPSTTPGGYHVAGLFFIIRSFYPSTDGRGVFIALDHLQKRHSSFKNDLSPPTSYTDSTHPITGGSNGLKTASLEID